MPKQASKMSTRENILAVSAQLFARNGYSGVSMREIAVSVGIQAASLYYHFPDKESLYKGVMTYAIRDRMSAPLAALQSDEPPFKKLEQFVARTIEGFSNNPDFLLLLERERLDGDAARQALLVDEVFAAPFAALMDVLQEIAPDQNPYRLAVSVSSLVMFPLEASSMARFFPGWRPEYERPDELIEHTCALLKSMLGQASSAADVALINGGKGDERAT